MVLDYAEHGSLRSYLNENYDKLSWDTKINDLYCIAFGLYNIHKNELIHRDLHIDANSLNRPTAEEIIEILDKWNDELTNNQSELNSEIREAEEINNNNLSTGNTLLTDLSYETHPEATYTSRLLNFNNLPEPVNYDDYYDEQDDKITSVRLSDSLQIDTTKLKN
ncbi:uncharacterized protein OCT59_012324 [Rhizophagus irregularis]|uniref:uncharacterized protein n=1 Tax=Rhizophagus irregularis TaxID=588596 RepID=UPI003326DE33|nr:hypothetical protein OCT59_012324 [Rhizophagus irregularis]